MKKEWLFFCILFFLSQCPTVFYPPSISGFNYCIACINVVTAAPVNSRQLLIAGHTEFSMPQVIAEQNAETLSGMARRCANNENIHSISRETILVGSAKADCNFKKI